MSSSNDTIKKTITVTVLVCLFCSIVVSTAAVMLKPLQEKNIEQDMKRNILAAAGMFDAERDVDEQFASVETKVVELSSGTYTDVVDAATYVPRAAAKDPQMSEALSGSDDLAKIGRQEKYALVYLVNDDSGKLQTVILPVRGYGLWSTMHGFIALESDLQTVVGLGFYEHGETPGLGGEIDNPRWKAQWPGKQVFNSEGDVELGLIKGIVDTSRSGAEYQIDGLSGATLTSKGVTNLVHFWLGGKGYGPYLDNLKAGKT